jgi:hypothetical protein
MAIYEVERLVRDVHRLGRFPAFDADRSSFCDSYDLTDQERAALLANDVGTLYSMGVHPMAVLFFSQANGEPMASYLARIGADEGRVSQFRGLFSSARSDVAREKSEPATS